MVGPRKKFFEAAFGKNIKEFKKLLIMPDNYIIYREYHKNNGAVDWWELYRSLSSSQKNEFLNIIHKNNLMEEIHTKCSKVNALIAHYKNPRAKIPENIIS